MGEDLKLGNDTFDRIREGNAGRLNLSVMKRLGSAFGLTTGAENRSRGAFLTFFL